MIKADLKQSYSGSRLQDGVEEGSLKFFHIFPISTILSTSLSLNQPEATLPPLYYASLIETKTRLNHSEKLNQNHFISPQRKQARIPVNILPLTGDLPLS